MKLSNFFPMPYYGRQNSKRTFAAEIGRAYSNPTGLSVAEVAEIDERIVSDLLYNFLNEFALEGLGYIDLKEFNKDAAHSLAKLVLGDFNAGGLDCDSFYVNTWFKNYCDNLYAYIIEHLSLINGKKRKDVPTYLDIGKKSLSYLWENKAVEGFDELISKIADAHAFIQAINCSPQYESSFLCFLDMYNYKRSYKQLSEFRSIVFGLGKLFFENIIYEYKNIALYEKNKFKKVFRSLIPLLISISSIVLFGFLLNLLALPEVVVAIAMIPTILVSIALSSLYIGFKNDLYNAVRELFYGGHFAIPEFQVNQRMIVTFGSLQNAERVREFYISALKYCDLLETEYKKTESWHTIEKHKQRIENHNRKESLSLEWFDIHSSKLPIEKASAIVWNQVKKSLSIENQMLQDLLTIDEENIFSSIIEYTSTLKDTFLESIDSPAEKPLPINFRQRVFKPKYCLIYKDRAEKIDKLEQIFKL